jgi:Asp-tRNA(Asn)/Glu-tRNA(Gln) amidotransferase C subunit
MSVTEDEVRRIAALARIRLESEELERLRGELNGILNHVESLLEVDVSGVEAEGHLDAASDQEPPLPSGPGRSEGVLPPDPLTPGAPGDQAPEWSEGFFLVTRLPGLDEDGP